VDPPNNVLIIPVQTQPPTPPIPGGCDFGTANIAGNPPFFHLNNPLAFVSYLEAQRADFCRSQNNAQGPCVGPPYCLRDFAFDNPNHLVVYPCGARLEGCGCSISSGATAGIPLYDSNPNFDYTDTSNPDCASPLILNTPVSPPPTGNGVLCHDGSAPGLAPCGPGQCLEGNIGCCPCDPPLPYGSAGPLIDGSQNSTESYWTAAPAPLGLPTPELLEDDPGARIAPDVQPIGAPLGIPLPTSSIAVTACNSCAGDGDEIDELSA
jgi:hypothetical protein